MNFPQPTLHPVINLFPKMSEADFQELKEDIRQNGLKTELVVWKDQLIDGRHRLRALNELGIDWRRNAVEIDNDELDPVCYAVSVNLKRRHLTPSQLAMVADKIRGIYDAEAKEAQRASGGDKKSDKESVVANLPQPKNTGKKARDKAAEAVGVGGKLVDAARTVNRMGSPELIAAVEAGDVAVTTAAEVAKVLPVDEQSQAVKSGTVAKKAAKVRAKKKQKTSAAESVKATARKINSLIDAVLKLDLTPEELEPLFDAVKEIEDKLTAFVSD